MAELQVDLNMRFEFDAITEAGAHLQPLSGPGHVGLVNLGNSCYMNSCLQVLFALPELAQRYVAPADGVFRSAPADPANDLLTQLAKVRARARMCVECAGDNRLRTEDARWIIQLVVCCAIRTLCQCCCL